MTRCSGCGAPILWLKTPKGRPMPCDPQPLWFVPDSQGRDRAVDEHGVTRSGVFVQAGAGGEIRAYRPHWSTCPAADKFRRPAVRR